MANPPYSCHSQYQDGRSGNSGGSPLPNNGQGQDTVPIQPKSGLPGPQQQASQRQSHSSGHPMLNHGMQHSSALQSSNGYPQSHASGMQQSLPWPQQPQQQQQSAPMSQQPNPSGQHIRTNGVQQCAPEAANSSATWQRPGQQPSVLGGQRAPQVKQEPHGIQHSNHALSQPGTWQPGLPGMALQQGQVPYQHPQSVIGPVHSQPQHQSNANNPSSIPIPQYPYQQRPSHFAHSLPMQHQGSQGRPLTIQEQFLALQQDSQLVRDPPDSQQNGSAQEHAKSGSPSQSGTFPLGRLCKGGFYLLFSAPT